MRFWSHPWFCLLFAVSVQLPRTPPECVILPAFLQFYLFLKPMNAFTYFPTFRLGSWRPECFSPALSRSCYFLIFPPISSYFCSFLLFPVISYYFNKFRVTSYHFLLFSAVPVISGKFVLFAAVFLGLKCVLKIVSKSIEHLSQIDPKSIKNQPKINPKSVKNQPQIAPKLHPGAGIDFSWFLVTCCTHFGPIFDPKMNLKTYPKSHATIYRKR